MKSAEIELFTLFEATPDFVCVAGKDGFFKKVNPAVIKKLGYTENELLAEPISSFIHPQDRPLTDKTRQELLGGKALLNFENRYVSKKGEIIWLEWTSIYFPDKEIVFGIAKDVTQRKQIEKQVALKYKKYKNLTTHFKNKVEHEKKYFANELHEDLAQLVAVVKMDINWVANNEPYLSPTAKNMIEHALAVSKLLIKTIQKISFAISPNTLDQFGLDATLEWLCKDFSSLNKIPCSFESDYNEENFSKEIKTDLFRICQESFSNILDISKADEIRIRIQENDKRLQLSISDTGKGFEVGEKKQSAGFINMKERVASINGKLKLHGKTGVGSRISITLNK
ncbi:MAG: PAS domain S-box protein [Bacteroidota bacterium]|nr:PAS domain S-box protein [Bacteroidota bacterium]